MIVDLVQITTRDGLRLDGALQSPADGTPPSLPLDAILCVHGTGGNFYSSTLFDALAGRALELGCAVLRTNTRGHDGISTSVTTRGGRRQGAAYEVVDECRHDLSAWIDWAQRRCGPRVGLVGHSLGAVKSIYTMAWEPHPAVACLVALSPPRLSYSAFNTSPRAADFLATYSAAEGHVESGRPAALMEVSLPLPHIVTASGYVEKYGPDERYNFLRFVGRLACPTLITFGGVEIEDNMAFRGVPEELDGTARAGRPIKVEIIPGGDHFYAGVRPELVSRVAAWLEAALPAP